MGIRRGTRRVTRVPAFAFTPKSLPGLVAWYRADKGASAGAWSDSSGTGDANKNLTGSGGPTFIANDATLNNQPSVTYTASSAQRHQSGVWASAFSQACTVFYVGKVPLAAVVGLDNLGSSFEITGSGATLELFAGAIFNTALSPASPAVLVCEFNGAGSNIYINKLSVSATGNAGSNGGTGITIGNASAGNFGVGGPIAEVGIYSRLLAAGERQQLTKYLGARYAIAIAA